MASSTPGRDIPAVTSSSAPASSAPVVVVPIHHHILPPTSGPPSTSRLSMPGPRDSQSPTTYNRGLPTHGQQGVGHPPTGNSPASTFTSPGVAPSTTVQSAQYQALCHLIKTTDPSIVRQVIRDTHELTLLGSDYHFAFLLNTAFHQANPTVLDQSVKKFGAKLVSSSLSSILSHMTTENLDMIADELLPKLSDDFLDRALDKRLSTIRARSLVNALAKAERLGYDKGDVVDETHGSTELVIPHRHPDLAQNPAQKNDISNPAQRQLGNQVNPYTPQVSRATQPQQNGKAQTIMCCSICARPCSGAHALRYHKMKKGCANLGTYERINRDICAHCGTIFANASGLMYHDKSQVCGNYTDDHLRVILPALQRFYYSAKPGWTSSPVSRPLPSASMDSPLVQQSGQSAFRAVNAGSAVPSPEAPSKNQDAYSHLSARDRATFDAAMRQIEEKYSEDMKTIYANASLSSRDREAELAKLKNRFNTKQSMTRKKYGIRLRERRPKHEIEAERSRILASSTPKPDYNISRVPVGEPAPKRQRTSMDGETGLATPSGRSSAVANLPTRVSVAEMGGLGNTTSTAELVDPTKSSTPTPTQPHQLSRPPPPTTLGTLLNPSTAPMVSGDASGVGKTADDPMEVDDDYDTDSDSNTDEPDNDDIPSILPQTR